jgi:hypothetical protein
MKITLKACLDNILSPEMTLKSTKKARREAFFGQMVV